MDDARRCGGQGSPRRQGSLLTECSPPRLSELAYKLQEVIKEVIVEVPKIVHMPMEVIKEVPVEIVKCVDREARVQA